MTRRADQQRFRDNQGRPRRTLGLSPSPYGPWISDEGPRRDGVNEASTDPELEAAMRIFLSDLTVPQRDAVRLVYWEQRSQRDAAAILGIAQPTLLERLRGAEKKIRDALVGAAGTEEYVEVRRWLTPSLTITDAGAVDRSEDARCILNGEPLASFVPNALGYDPWLTCAKHRAERQ